MVPALRVRTANTAPLRPERSFVLYWMIASRRTTWNFALDRAVEQSTALQKPLLVLEALRTDYPWACDRFHQFVIDGMHDNAQRFASAAVRYLPYVEASPGAAHGLLDLLASHAALIVTDDFPGFFLPRMVTAAANRVDVRMEAVDGNGLLPLNAVETTFPTAHAFRRVLQRLLPAHLDSQPTADPLALNHAHAPCDVPPEVTARWPSPAPWLAGEARLAALSIDHHVGPTITRGGERAARAQLRTFLDTSIDRYAAEHNDPDPDVTSRLSPYLHWGHISVHEVFDAVMRRAGWMGHVGQRATGAREGWWGVDANAESFLDELITWRELGYNMSSTRADHDRFDSLPAWALRTLRAHASDPRETRYTLDIFDRAETADPLWNAAQRQLVTEGRIHNYLRMLWGKKILEWSASPEDALDIMIELNNTYALDGRDPNSYSGIFWVLGRYDRAWGPERPIFGTVRYMSSTNTARKWHVTEYLRRYGDGRARI